MPRIFISYRRADTEIITGRVNDRLIRDFGARNVFKDVDDIPPSADFRKVLHDEIVKCPPGFGERHGVWRSLAALIRA